MKHPSEKLFISDAMWIVINTLGIKIDQVISHNDDGDRGED